MLRVILSGRGMEELEPVLADAGAASLPLDAVLAAASSAAIALSTTCARAVSMTSRG